MVERLSDVSEVQLQSAEQAWSPEYARDDSKLMVANTTSGFNYRMIAGTNKVSKHGEGRAFDVNPRLKPYIRYAPDGTPLVIEPPGACWIPDIPGTLHVEHPLVMFMKSRGWAWGGDWTATSGRTDYQHFKI